MTFELIVKSRTGVCSESGPPRGGTHDGPNERFDVRLPLQVAWRGHVHSHFMGGSHAEQPVQKG